MEYGDIIPNEIGTSGQVLTSNGPGLQPTFQDGGGGDPSFIGFYANIPTTGISLPDNTTVVITASNEIYDTGGCYDNSTYRFTPTTEGYYLAWCKGMIYDDGSRIVNARVFASIRHNGTAWNGSSVKKFGSTQVNMNFSTEFFTVYYCNGTTDYLDATLYANSFGAQTQTAMPWDTAFGASLINTA